MESLLKFSGVFRDQHNSLLGKEERMLWCGSWEGFFSGRAAMVFDDVHTAKLVPSPSPFIRRKTLDIFILFWGVITSPGRPPKIGFWLWERSKRNISAPPGVAGVSPTCVDLHAGFLAHVSQLDNHMVFPSWLQFLYGVLHCAVPAFHLVDFICFPHQIFNCHGIELQGEEMNGKKISFSCRISAKKW